MYILSPNFLSFLFCLFRYSRSNSERPNEYFSVTEYGITIFSYLLSHDTFLSPGRSTCVSILRMLLVHVAVSLPRIRLFDFSQAIDLSKFRGAYLAAIPKEQACVRKRRSALSLT
ncbi:hypothetical protein F4774DRAFT_725 [Daldinia eschscholtzii]|nr:hypothetical protein F4774DRAFT_725 [Daldinia eschscholtzii]